MTMFDKREQAYEAKFAHDEEVQFKINARRNKLLGLWAAHHLRFEGEKAENYARDFMETNINHHNEQTLIGKILMDLEAAGIRMAKSIIEDELFRCADTAQNEILRGA